MENDASSAGVRLGGLYSTTEIRILICYILSSVDEPIPASILSNMLHFEGIANGFEVSDAIVSLENNGHITAIDNKKEYYVITESGREIANELKTSLSLVVKERAFLLTMKMLTKIKNAKDTLFELTKENGKSYLSCSALDNKIPFITVKLLITDESQVGLIKDRFLENPSLIFSKIIEMLTK